VLTEGLKGLAQLVFKKSMEAIKENLPVEIMAPTNSPIDYYK